MKIRVSTIRVILLSHHVFQYLLIPWYLTNLQNHTTCAFFGVDALSMSLKQNRITDRENGNPTARRNIKGKKENTSGKKHNRISNKSTVDALALKIGLNVVPAAAPSKLNLNTNRNTRQENKSEKKLKHNSTTITLVSPSEEPERTNVPIIAWGANAKRFFWGFKEQGMDRSVSTREGRNLNVQPILNDQGFPLYQIKNVLPRNSPSFKRLMSLLTEDGNANAVMSQTEEMEQHELVRGKPQTLRRSLVSQLIYSDHDHDDAGNHRNRSREILNLIQKGLPKDLVGGMGSKHIGTNPTSLDHFHPYEDGSVVYYRTTGKDFYNTHHDSYDPRDPPRDRQRAYTILLYLRSPKGSPLIGGTEFPRLTQHHHFGAHGKEKEGNDIHEKQRREQVSSGKRGLVVKPDIGDAIVWPNFDQEGKPYMDSIHRALSIPKSTCGQRFEMGKIVINLWFEGFQI
mmetsp:Transcript_35972/g.52722  ORF Transcript_35972/g.52722 Transcript_35972/m.52722 type:complete len:456 (-) Transcript_35972:473-1840(-)